MCGGGVGLYFCIFTTNANAVVPVGPNAELSFDKLC